MKFLKKILGENNPENLTKEDYFFTRKILNVGLTVKSGSVGSKNFNGGIISPNYQYDKTHLLSYRIKNGVERIYDKNLTITFTPSRISINYKNDSSIDFTITEIEVIFVNL